MFYLRARAQCICYIQACIFYMHACIHTYVHACIYALAGVGLMARSRRGATKAHQGAVSVCMHAYAYAYAYVCSICMCRRGATKAYHGARCRSPLATSLSSYVVQIMKRMLNRAAVSALNRWEAFLVRRQFGLDQASPPHRLTQRPERSHKRSLGMRTVGVGESVEPCGPLHPCTLHPCTPPHTWFVPELGPQHPCTPGAAPWHRRPHPCIHTYICLGSGRLVIWQEETSHMRAVMGRSLNASLNRAFQTYAPCLYSYAYTYIANIYMPPRFPRPSFPDVCPFPPPTPHRPSTVCPHSELHPPTPNPSF